VGARFANVASTLALVLALGGTGAVAASQITSNRIGDRQVKRVDLSANAVISAKVKDGTLLARDVAGGKGPRGAPGQSGAVGVTGDAGAPGPASFHLPAVLPSGATLRGAYAFSGYRSGRNPPMPNENGEANGVISFPVPLASVPTIVLIRRKQPQNEEGDPTTQCPGSVLNPQAAPGFVCVYESKNADNTKLEAFSPYDDTGHTATRFGVGLFLTAPQNPNSTHRTSSGSWAVTAP